MRVFRSWLALGALVGSGCGAASPDGAYEPCTAAATCPLMPLGDSITYGIASSDGGGYRVPLLRHVRAGSQHLTFVGSVENGPASVDGEDFPRQNEGHPGYAIDATPERAGLTPLISAAIAAYPPRIITLMAGTNDIATNYALEEAPARFARLLDVILAEDPHVLLIVGQLIPTADPGLNTLVTAFNDAIPGIVSERALNGYAIEVVDLYTPFINTPDFVAACMADVFHPNDAGFQVMADTWYAALSRHLPSRK